MAKCTGITSAPCPLCKSKSGLLNGNTKKRFFCMHCCIEFKTDIDGVVEGVYTIGPGGDLESISGWENKK